MYSKLEKVKFGVEGVPISAVQICCSVDSEAGILIPDDGDGLLRLFVVHRIGRSKKVLRELMVEDDYPQDVHGHHLLQAYPVRMLDLAIVADMNFVEAHIVRSVVFLHYVPTDIPQAGLFDDVPLYWLWTDDRKVLLGGTFQLPSVTTSAFTSGNGVPISTWCGNGGITVPPLALDNNEDEHADVSEGPIDF